MEHFPKGKCFFLPFFQREQVLRRALGRADHDPAFVLAGEAEPSLRLVLDVIDCVHADQALGRLIVRKVADFFENRVVGKLGTLLVDLRG